MNRYLGLVAVIAVIGLTVWESKFHFNRESVTIKRQHNSGQRHWNLFFPQRIVYVDSSMRFLQDFAAMTKLVEPGSVVFSDKATSYFAAAEIPVYAVNIHSHQGRWRRPTWQRFIDDRYFCYQEFAENRVKSMDFLKRNTEVDYVIVNRSGKSRHRKRDCMAFRSHTLNQYVPNYSTRVYSGEYLDLYRIDRQKLSARHAETR